ncbi:alkene reductase [Methylobacterium sp. AMS5]|uniref:alkene reductase n=1 Tax=Methylobacterium sp. AMS5 TaxID=925818 RepID=UPI00074F8532|nr:alkene reductase [Methylobacterium sp. AMS5]AMB43374.1 N-ethylmaleimide reductase [Methylobacterium sp. AMS5]
MADAATLSRTRDPAAASDPAVLFQPYRLGPLELPHRIIMAPLTRSRARSPGNVPSPLAACYYAQRASAALIVSEAAQVSIQGQGYAWTPGIHSSAQVEGWRHVTKAVHESGGRIFCQLWHVGRISHPALQPDNMLPVAPSAITPQGKAFIENERGEGALVPFVRPRALALEEMPYIVGQYERAARNAQSADFDGVEIHAANGYLLDQFIESSTNRRSDTYGGSVENRTRLLLEVAEALSRIWGPDRIGVRISPLGRMNEIRDDDPEATFGYISERLAEFDFAYLHVVNPALEQMQKGEPPDQRSLALVQLIRERFKGTLIAAGGFDAGTAARWIHEGRADLVAFGRKFIANPDLPERLRADAPLNADDPTTYYGGGENGYTDYPDLAQERGERPRGCVDRSWR